MATFGVTAVRLNVSNNRVDRVKMGLVNTAENKWASEIKDVPVIEVVNAIVRGDKVFTIFPESGQTILGPRLRTFAYPGGVEGIEVRWKILKRMKDELSAICPNSKLNDRAEPNRPRNFRLPRAPRKSP